MNFKTKFKTRRKI